MTTAALRPAVWSVGTVAVLAVLASGCIGEIRSTTTARTAEEQLLISTAVQDAIGRVDASQLKDRIVYVDADRLETIDRGYVLSAFDEAFAVAGAFVARNPEEADVIVEVRSAVLNAYDGHWKLWIPLVYATNAAGETDRGPKVFEPAYVLHEGWAHVQAFAYERSTGRLLFGWRNGWGYAYNGLFENIYPERDLVDTLREQVE